MNIVGTPKKIVTCPALIRLKICSASKPLQTTEAPPASTRGAVKTFKPPVWKSGVLRMVVSSALRPQLVTVLIALKVMLP